MISKDIIGKSIIIRTANSEDAEFTFNIRQDREKTKYMPQLAGTIDSQKLWLQKQRESNDCYFFVVESKDGEKIGVYSLYNISNGTAESGRAILNGNPIQNMEANIMLYEFAFCIIHLNCVTMEIFSNNNSAIGVSQKVGAVETKRTFSEKYNDYIVEMKVTYDQYMERREKLMNLISRFGDR